VGIGQCVPWSISTLWFAEIDIKAPNILERIGGPLKEASAMRRSILSPCKEAETYCLS